MAVISIEAVVCWTVLYYIFIMEWTVEEIAEFLEHEMSNAFEVRDKDSLKRCVNLLARNAVSRREYETETSGIRGEIKILAEKIERNGEIMRQGFAETHERFESLQHNMDKRFEQVDKRFEAQQQYMDKRFESIRNNMDKRFEQVDKRFEAQQQYMDKRFEQMDKRFSHLFTFMTLGFSLLVVIVTLFKFLM